MQTLDHKLKIVLILATHRAAGCTPFAVSIIGDYFPENLRGTAISIYYFGIYIGYSLAFAIGNSTVELLSWRWVFFVSGLIGTINVQLLVRPSPLLISASKPGLLVVVLVLFWYGHKS